MIPATLGIIAMETLVHIPGLGWLDQRREVNVPCLAAIHHGLEYAQHAKKEYDAVGICRNQYQRAHEQENVQRWMGCQAELLI